MIKEQSAKQPSAKKKSKKEEHKVQERVASPPSPYDNLELAADEVEDEEEEQEYDFDEEDEGIEDYKIGGYPPN